MFGSGSAPRTIAPGRPQGVQQTMLAFGVLRGIAVMPGVGFGYPCSTYVPCLFAFRASADEETEMPRAQTSNPSRTDVLLLLAMTMAFSLDFYPRRETQAPMAGEASGTLLAVSGSWSLEQCRSAWKSKRTGSVSRGFPSGSKTPLYTISTREGSRGRETGRYGFGRRAVAIHKEFQCLVMHLNQFACRTTNKMGTGRRTICALSAPDIARM